MEKLFLIDLFESYIKDTKMSGHSASLLHHLIESLKRDAISESDVIKILIGRIDEITEKFHEHISLHSKPPSIFITAESEEGKRFIENFKKWKGE